MSLRGFATTLLIALSGCAALGQDGAPAFEVASIKRQILPPNVFVFYKPNSDPIRISGNRVTLTVTLQKLVLAAYNLNDEQVSGGPDWAKRQGGDPYEIAAKVNGDGTPPLDEVRRTLQTLLAERFQLKFHREMKELPVYTLAIAKGGLKMKPTAPGAPPRPAANARNWTPGVMVLDQSQTMAEFARGLALLLDRPVTDQTGLEGKYDIRMESALNLRDPPAPGVELPEGYYTHPKIPQALEEQLGLKLESAREATEVLVIDRVERPSDN